MIMFAKAITLTGLCFGCMVLQIAAKQYDDAMETKASILKKVEEDASNSFGHRDDVMPKGERGDLPLSLIGGKPKIPLQPTIQHLMGATRREEIRVFEKNPDGSIVSEVVEGYEPPPNAAGVGLLASEPVQLYSTLNWHVGVYAKYHTPYMQICGGTLVTTKAVISAAHCFWKEKGMLPAGLFAIAAGKSYRPWNDPQDSDSQKSEVEAIHVPVRYRGDAASYQEDIAVLLLATEMETNVAVKPACVDFGEEFDDEQLRHGNLGTILGWGLIDEDGKPSPVLNYLEVPAVDLQECLARAEPGFLRYITSDKICAGGIVGKAICRGDSGGGLVFFSGAGRLRVPYLRGVASTAPRNEHACNAHAPSALTHVRAHRAFLRKHIPDLEEECKKHFKVSEELQDRTASVQPAADKPIQCVCNCFCNKDPAPSQEGPIIFRH